MSLLLRRRGWGYRQRKDQISEQELNGSGVSRFFDFIAKTKYQRGLTMLQHETLSQIQIFDILRETFD